MQDNVIIYKTYQLMKKNLLFRFCALVVCIACALGANAYDFVSDGIYYTIINGNEVSLVNNGSINTYSGEVTIPATVTYGGVQYAITSIGDYAFYTTAGDLETIHCYCTTPPAVHANSFSSCEYIVVPFEALEDYYVADGWSTAYTYYIMGEVFDFAVDNILYKITGENTVGVCPSYMGYGKESGHEMYVWNSAQTNLENITIPATVTHGGKTYTVTSMEPYALFYGQARSISLPNTITVIGESAFSQCSKITDFSLPESVTVINDYAFYGCSAIENMSLPARLTHIGVGAFMYLYKWNVDLVIPEKITRIERNAFYQCFKMHTLTLGPNVEWIGIDAFGNLDSLAAVICEREVPPVMEHIEYEEDGLQFSYDPFYVFFYSHNVVRVPYGSHEAYRNADVWNKFNYLVSDQVVEPAKAGDVTGDDEVNMDDLTRLINYLLTQDATGMNLLGADVDGNTSVTMDDLTALINMLLTNSSNGITRPGEHRFLITGVPFTMIKVDGGSFMMGNSGLTATSPVHQVTLSDYNIGQTEVTQQLWKTVMKSNPSEFSDDLNRPVEMVNWNDCQDFVNKMIKLTGKNFRLPTEAEWEFAARGGNRSQGYNYAGSNTLGDVAWYKSNSDDKTHPVATKAPNELGLYDMTGNVFEWCQDWWGYYSSEAQVNPQGPASGDGKVCRSCGFNRTAGTSWFFNYGRCYDDIETKTNDTGMRLAL